MKSQYLERYLDDSDQRIAAGGAPITPGTFLAYQLRGRAKQWISRYLAALVRSLKAADTVETTSVGGCTAYRRRDAA